MDEEEKAQRKQDSKEAQILALEGFGNIAIVLGMIHGLWTAGKAWLMGDSILATAGLTFLLWLVVAAVPLGFAYEMRIKHKIKKTTVHTVPWP